jgi:hypothetical protein
MAQFGDTREGARRPASSVLSALPGREPVGQKWGGQVRWAALFVQAGRLAVSIAAASNLYWILVFGIDYSPRDR